MIARAKAGKVGRHLRLAVLTLLFVACGGEKKEERTKNENVALGGEVAVRVGDQAIPLAVVSSVARAQKIGADDALKLVTDDAIAAYAAKAQGLDQRTPTSWGLISARARWMSERFLEEAKAKGPPTDDEVKTLSEAHWVEVDRPPMLTVIHAIALRPTNPKHEGEAKQLANALHDAVMSATSADDFEKKANAVATPSPTVKSKIERLPPFTDQGWTTNNARMDKTFTEGAYALAKVGDTSAVIETSFGWHVIRLVERLPELRMPFETRRIAFTDEVYAMRARTLYDERLKALRAVTPIAISPAAIQLTEQVTPPKAPTQTH